ILAIVSGGEVVASAEAGANIELVLDRTPFYAESGGQLADEGTIETNTGKIKITNVKKTKDGKFLHIGEVTEGTVAKGDEADCSVCKCRRDAVGRAHSATHLLQKALRNTLGTHVEQAGSLVGPDSIRFDFTHFSALTPEELSKVEAEVNAKILEGLEITVREMPIEEAKKLGAMALFGEKYGETVRVVTMGDYSLELCGGTHLDNTAKSGIVKIVSEASVAAGVRRIEAICGKGVLAKIAELEGTIDAVAEALKSAPREVVIKAEHQAEEIKSLRQELSAMNSKMAALDAAEYIKSATDMNGIKFVAKEIKNAKGDDLRAICDEMRGLDSSVAALLASVNGEKIVFTATCGKDVIARGIKAGDLVRETAKTAGGNGGGKPDFAMAGGNDVSKLADALKTAEEFVKSRA
ncbi:MAG: alanine--tRNA ligase, partial [Oscillospiraceae bacterium]|nr:alanine--tRNA ligase [Oscillospiraceae bacterium]